jgi:hypothetical protein
LFTTRLAIYDIVWSFIYPNIFKIILELVMPGNDLLIF